MLIYWLQSGSATVLIDSVVSWESCTLSFIVIFADYVDLCDVCDSENKTIYNQVVSQTCTYAILFSIQSILIDDFYKHKQLFDTIW